MCYEVVMHLRAHLAASTIAAVFFLLPVGPEVQLGGVKAAHAHSYVEISIDFLAQRATRVVVAMPVDDMSVWEEAEGGKRIVTYHRVQVQADVVGEGDQEIWVRRLGGVVEGVGQIVHGAATLRTGQPMMLFLAKRTDGTFSVIGMDQGCFPVTIDKDKKVRIARRTLSHAPVPSKRVLRPASALEGRSCEDAKQMILEARKRHAK